MNEKKKGEESSSPSLPNFWRVVLGVGFTLLTWMAIAAYAYGSIATRVEHLEDQYQRIESKLDTIIENMMIGGR